MSVMRNNQALKAVLVRVCEVSLGIGMKYGLKQVLTFSALRVCMPTDVGRWRSRWGHSSSSRTRGTSTEHLRLPPRMPGYDATEMLLRAKLLFFVSEMSPLQRPPQRSVVSPKRTSQEPAVVTTSHLW